MLRLLLRFFFLSPPLLLSFSFLPPSLFFSYMIFHFFRPVLPSCSPAVFLYSSFLSCSPPVSLVPPPFRSLPLSLNSVSLLTFLYYSRYISFLPFFLPCFRSSCISCFLFFLLLVRLSLIIPSCPPSCPLFLFSHFSPQFATFSSHLIPSSFSVLSILSFFQFLLYFFSLVLSYHRSCRSPDLPFFIYF